jgi:hypothetical protein
MVTWASLTCSATQHDSASAAIKLNRRSLRFALTPPTAASSADSRIPLVAKCIFIGRTASHYSPNSSNPKRRFSVNSRVRTKKIKPCKLQTSGCFYSCLFLPNLYLSPQSLRLRSTGWPIRKQKSKSHDQNGPFHNLPRLYCLS